MSHKYQTKRKLHATVIKFCNKISLQFCTIYIKMVTCTQFVVFLDVPRLCKTILPRNLSHMMTSSNGKTFRLLALHWWPVETPHKGQWRGALLFSLICAWNGWAINWDVGDLRRHRADYDAIVMICLLAKLKCIFTALFTNAYLGPFCGWS